MPVVYPRQRSARRHLLIMRIFNKVVVLLVAASLPATASQAASENEPPKVEAELLSRVETKDPVVFVTIDDGHTRSIAAQRTLDQLGWPVTSFVLTRPFASDPSYFQTIGRGSELGNHTISHKDMKTLSFADQKREICNAQKVFRKKSSNAPVFFRPPYGRLNQETLKAAASCGITHVVLWKVVVSDGRIATQGGPIRRGDVILLHYVKSLDKSLKVLDLKLRSLGLRPALLGNYLSEK